MFTVIKANRLQRNILKCPQLNSYFNILSIKNTTTKNFASEDKINSYLKRIFKACC